MTICWNLALKKTGTSLTWSDVPPQSITSPFPHRLAFPSRAQLANSQRKTNRYEFCNEHAKRRKTKAHLITAKYQFSGLLYVGFCPVMSNFPHFQRHGLFHPVRLTAFHQA
jgi:hypothetical protein